MKVRKSRGHALRLTNKCTVKGLPIRGGIISSITWGKEPETKIIYNKQIKIPRILITQ